MCAAVDDLHRCAIYDTPDDDSDPIESEYPNILLYSGDYGVGAVHKKQSISFCGFGSTTFAFKFPYLY